ALDTGDRRDRRPGPGVRRRQLLPSTSSRGRRAVRGLAAHGRGVPRPHHAAVHAGVGRPARRVPTLRARAGAIPLGLAATMAIATAEDARARAASLDAADVLALFRDRFVETDP